MAVVSTDFLTALLTNFQTRFGQTWNEPMSTDRLLAHANRIQSTTLKETVPFVGAVSGGPQDVTQGQVAFQNMQQFTLTITNREWSDAFAIKRAEFEDDRYKLYGDKPAEMAAGHKAHIGELIGDLPEAGVTGLAYDGLTFFHATRTIGDSGTINNIVSGGFSGTPTVAEFLAALRAGQARAMAFKNNKGRKMGIRMNTIEVPDLLYDVAWEAFQTNASINTGAERNAAPPEGVFKAGQYTVVWNHRLTDVNNFHMYHVDPARGRFPYVWTDRTSPALQGTTSVDSEVWTELREAHYTTYGRYEAGFGEPRFALQITGS